MITLHDLLTARMAALTWSTADLHRALWTNGGVFVSQQAVYQWVSGRVVVRDAYRPVLARVLGLDLAELASAAALTDAARLPDAARRRLLGPDDAPVAVAS